MWQLYFDRIQPWCGILWRTGGFEGEQRAFVDISSILEYGHTQVPRCAQFLRFFRKMQKKVSQMHKMVKKRGTGSFLGGMYHIFRSKTLRNTFLKKIEKMSFVDKIIQHLIAPRGGGRGVHVEGIP